jgi:hypothetical protein
MNGALENEDTTTYTTINSRFDLTVSGQNGGLACLGLLTQEKVQH